MNYHILIIRNRYTKRLQLQKCFDWFKENANLNITTEEITTDFDLEAIKVGNHKLNGLIVGGLNAKLKPIVPENKYNAVIFVYSNGLIYEGKEGVRLNAANWEGSLYQNTELIQVADPRWQTVNHEMFHGFFGKLSRMGIGQHVGVVDNMDTYFRDNILDVTNGDTNRVIALRTLKPYWDKIVTLSPIQVLKLVEVQEAQKVTALKIGSKGPAVVELQKDLGIKADGDFGPMTKKIVIAFQTANGLVADGIAGAATFAKIEEIKKKI